MELKHDKELLTQKRIILLIASLGSFVTPFMAASVNIALPGIGKEFHMNAVSLGWIATSYQLAAAVFLVPMGKLADIRGRKFIYFYGMVIYWIASLLCAVSFSEWMLIASRILQGIGGAMIFGTGVAILTSVYPREERGKALGIVVSFTYVGLSAGPFLGGILTEYLGWRSIFYILLPLGIAVLILVKWKLKGEWAEAKNDSLDLKNTLMYAISLFLIIYGLTVLPQKHGYLLISAGLLLLYIFLVLQGRMKSPLIHTYLFKTSRSFAYSNLAALINYSATFGVTFLLSLYLQYVRLLSPGQAGVILIAQPLTMALFSPISGRLSDKIESQILASAGMGITVAGLTVLAFFNKDTPVSLIVVSLIFLGFGFALFSSPNTNAVMSSVEKKFYGVASATLSTMRIVGQMLSMGIAMLLINVFIGKAKISAENANNYLLVMKTAFIIFSVLCFIGVFASLARGKRIPVTETN